MAGSSLADPMDAVRQFIDGFNTGDAERARAACAEETSIIDDFPPHEWSGRLAIAEWFGDMARLSAEFGMSEPWVTLGEPRHVIVTDRHAYVVVPIDVRWLDNGAPAERGGSITVALREGAHGWRISAWAWTWD